ncbi:hypothetical protein [Patulibacter sp. SYSU D01012]|uniref:hypothetical protein n=1 Tax=Patulibacter sp. SYSU D01012 TaxID=2817381 RepID=UPI001B30FEC5|nr:hypothetical protein [Patulibacter sp. SYSU D01012]
MPRLLTVAPLLVTAALGLAACGGDSSEDKAKDLEQKSEQLQKDIQSGKLSPDEIAERTKELANDPAVKEQLEKARKELEKMDPDDIQKQLKDSGVDTDKLNEQLEELEQQRKELTVPSS